MIRLAVVADDRTGALETAGICADVGLDPAVVGTALSLHQLGSAQLEDFAVVVVDIASRHVTRDTAAQRAIAAASTFRGERSAHKIDSTLRGNWAAELVARSRQSGCRTLIVPAFPDVGRTCVGGVVLDHGTPVSDGHAGSDPLAPVRSSRPSEHLLDAGVSGISQCASATEVQAWLDDGEDAFAICDAQSHADLGAIADAWSSSTDVLYAGTGAAIGAAAAALSDASDGRATRSRMIPGSGWVGSGAVLVICGSLHPVARLQMAALAERGAWIEVVRLDDEDDNSNNRNVPEQGRFAALAGVLGMTDGVAAIISPEVRSAPAIRPTESAVTPAESLGRVAQELIRAHDIARMIVVGGDTAEGLIGDQPMVVHGTVEPGIAVGSLLHDPDRLIITKAGGFGDPATLVRLVYG